jgi:hypothetical protein
VPLGKKAKKMEYIALVISLAGLLFPLLTTSNENGPVVPNKKDTTAHFPVITQKKNIKPIPPAPKRSLTLSGIVEDAETGAPLDSVALFINDVVTGYTNELGRFHITRPVDPSLGAIIISYQKKGYLQMEDNLSTSVKNANIDLVGKRIKLNKL